MRSLSAQHCGVRVGQGAQSEKPQDYTPSGPADQWSVDVRSDAPVRPHHGGTDPQQTGEQTIRVPGRRKISRVSIRHILFLC